MRDSFNNVRFWIGIGKNLAVINELLGECVEIVGQFIERIFASFIVKVTNATETL